MASWAAPPVAVGDSELPPPREPAGSRACPGLQALPFPLTGQILRQTTPSNRLMEAAGFPFGKTISKQKPSKGNTRRAVPEEATFHVQRPVTRVLQAFADPFTSTSAERWRLDRMRVKLTGKPLYAKNYSPLKPFLKTTEFLNIDIVYPPAQ